MQLQAKTIECSDVTKRLGSTGFAHKQKIKQMQERYKQDLGKAEDARLNEIRIFVAEVDQLKAEKMGIGI